MVAVPRPRPNPTVGRRRVRTAPTLPGSPGAAPTTGAPGDRVSAGPSEAARPGSVLLLFNGDPELLLHVRHDRPLRVEELLVHRRPAAQVLDREQALRRRERVR